MVKFAACLEELFGCREAIPSPRSSPRCTVASNPSSRACHTSTRMSPSCPPSSDASRTQTTIALSLSLRSSERLLSLSARYLRSSHSGRPLWPPVPSTLHEAFLAGATEPTSVVVLTWDAALHGWGLVLHWWDNRNGKVISGSLPNSDEIQHQADGRLSGVSAGLSPSRLPTRKSNY